MNPGTRKIVIVVSMLCYLASASVAAMHALPMSMNDRANTALVFESPHVQLVSDAEAGGAHCHSPDNEQADSLETTTCTIVCAALAQAVAENASLTISLEVPVQSATLLSPLVISRQLDVEPHPPK